MILMQVDFCLLWLKVTVHCILFAALVSTGVSWDSVDSGSSFLQCWCVAMVCYVLTALGRVVDTNCGRQLLCGVIANWIWIWIGDVELGVTVILVCFCDILGFG